MAGAPLPAELVAGFRMGERLLQEPTCVSPLQGLLPPAPCPHSQLESLTLCLPCCTTPAPS